MKTGYAPRRPRRSRWRALGLATADAGRVERTNQALLDQVVLELHRFFEHRRHLGLLDRTGADRADEWIEDVAVVGSPLDDLQPLAHDRFDLVGPDHLGR